MTTNKEEKRYIEQRLKELDEMRVFESHQRNGEGLTRCRLCNQITWDSFCFTLKVFDDGILLNETIICDECNGHISKNKLYNK